MKDNMKIESVILKTVIVINGVEHSRKEMDFTNSVHQAVDSGIEMTCDEDVFDWVEVTN